MFVGILALKVLNYRIPLDEDWGNRVVHISRQIQEGASSFLQTEYKYLLIFVIVVFLILGAIAEVKSWLTALCFVIGAATSALCGYIGMSIAVRSNCTC